MGMMVTIGIKLLYKGGMREWDVIGISNAMHFLIRLHSFSNGMIVGYNWIKIHVYICLWFNDSNGIRW